jgi:hypothetical protein
MMPLTGKDDVSRVTFTHQPMRPSSTIDAKRFLAAGGPAC